MPLHYRQLNQTRAGVTFGEGRVPREPAEERDDGGQRPHGAGNLLQQLPERWELPVWVLLPSERSREEAGAVSPDRAGSWRLARAAGLSSWKKLEKPSPEHPPRALRGPCRCHPALLALGTGGGRAASSPTCRCGARCQPAARVSSRCKCYEFFTKQASLIV